MDDRTYLIRWPDMLDALREGGLVPNDVRSISFEADYSGTAELLERDEQGLAQIDDKGDLVTRKVDIIVMWERP